MAGQVYLSLLNPALALSFAGLAAMLWRKFPRQTHLFPLAIAFLYLAIAFISQEWSLLSRPGAINYAANALFFAAVVLVCVSALMRAQVKVPVILFAATACVAAAGFAWFAFVEPSIRGRIYFQNGCFAALAMITAWGLVRRGVRNLADRLFVGGMIAGAMVAAGRPMLVLFGLLDVGNGNEPGQSAYWQSIVGLTPFLAILSVSLFIFALVLDMMEGLQRDADHDYLTGLLNRRGFEVGARNRLAQMRRPAALMVADIDDFKQINDRYGHAVGDRVIAAVGDVLSRHGMADLTGRIGGEEFALFYDIGSRHTLQACAKEIGAALADVHVADLPIGHRMTLSLGLHVQDGNESLDEMMRRADRALYEAKAAGKNRAVLTPVRLRTV